MELYWNFIGVDRNFIGAVSLRYWYVIGTLLVRYRYVIATLSLRYWYIADFPATATLLVSVRPCIITSKVKQQVMGSMDQRVPWNQFIREAKVGHSGSPTCDCCGIRRWTCYKKCTSALALGPQLLLVRRESAGVQECAGVILWTSLCRRNVSTFV